MSTLDSLIRLHRWQLDEKRRQLAELEALAERLREEQRRLEEEDRREQMVAAASPETAFVYAGYAHSVIERRRKLAQSQREIAEQLTRAHDELAEAFQEMKRYEIAAANRARQAEMREARRQQGVMDDVAIESFRRRDAGGLVSGS